MLVRVTLTAALTGLLFGMDLGVMGGALLDLRDSLGTQVWTEQLIVGSAKLGAVFGAALGGAAMLVKGRRWALLLDAVAYVLGPALQAIPPASLAVPFLVVGRLVTGLGIGISAVCVPVYLGELAPARRRGLVVSSYEVALTLGALLAALCSAAMQQAGLGWRAQLAAPLLPALVLLALAPSLPESPRWLVTRGRMDEALVALQGVLGGASPRRDIELGAVAARGEEAGALAAVEDELLELWSVTEKERAAEEAWRREARGGGAAVKDGFVRLGAGVEGGRGSDGVKVAGERAALLGAQPGPDSALSPQEEDGSEVSCRASSAPLAPFRIEDLDAGGSDSPPSEPAAEPSGSSRRPPLPPPPPSIGSTLARKGGDVLRVLRGPERRALCLVLALALFNQGMASTSVLNYAPTLLAEAGLRSHALASLASAAVAACKVAGVVLGAFLVDRLGRRPLLVVGGAACAAALALLVPADAAGSVGFLLPALCAFVLAFSASWAGVFWVLLSELFSMTAKSPACVAATATLFLAGAASDLSFLSLRALAGGWAFALYAAVAAAGAAYVALRLPETRHKTLRQVQDLLRQGGS